LNFAGAILSTDSRYSVPQKEYMQSVGKLLPHRIGQILETIGYKEELGYKVSVTKGQSNGSDLVIFREGSPVLAAEIVNWSIMSDMNSVRQYWIIRNLEDYGPEVIKVLIHSTFSNETMLEAIHQHGISTLRIDYQILPKSFFDNFASKNQIESRRIDSRITFEEIKAKIVHFLIESGLEIPHKKQALFSVTDSLYMIPSEE
jgi:hypothetical protein